MKRKKTQSRHRAGPAPGDVEPGGSTDSGEILERPDGFYWKAPDGRAEIGPFEKFERARADRDAQPDAPPQDGEALHEAERNIGINEWMDVETGEPAEGESPPHLDEE
jgi:hypothetical protein